MIRILFLLPVAILLPVFLNAQNIVWEHTYNPVGGKGVINDLVISEMGEIFAVGYETETSTNLAFPTLIKLDSIGNVLWINHTTYDTGTYGNIGFIKTITDRPNEFYLLLNRIGSSSFKYEEVIIRIDTAADTIWTKPFVYGFSNTITEATVLKDQSIVTVGSQITPSNYDIIARRIDSLGNIMWEEIYSLPGSQIAYDIVEMLDGSLVIGGSNDGQNLIMRIGFDGQLINNTAIQIPNGTVRFQDINLFARNKLGMGILSRQGTQNYGYYYQFDSLLSLTSVINKEQGIYVGPIFSVDSSLFFSQLMSSDSFQLNSVEFTSNLTSWYFNYGYVNNPKFVGNLEHAGTNLIGSGYDDSGANQVYYLVKISGVGEEWIPDRCAYQPPIAGFEWEYNYPVLTLRDTSSGGLKYLDTVYTWQWNTSNGFSGTNDSLLVFFDTTTAKTLDVRLIISNWYGCMDTITETLVFGPNGIRVEKPLEFKIYPNPVKEQLTIELSEIPNEAVLLELFDIRGILKYKTEFQNKTLHTSLSALPSGMYFYRISSNSQVMRGKVVKE